MIEFIKKRYNILIPIFLIIVIAVAVILYTREYKNNRYAQKKDVEVYQYFSGNKIEYTTSISRNKKNNILALEPADSVVNLDSTPIYIKDKANVIFPKEMAYIFPLDNKQYMVPALSEIYYQNNLYYLNIRSLNKTFKHGFLFDGKDLYFFLDNVSVVVGDKEVNLSPMSYLTCIHNNLLEYYNKEKDEYGKIDVVNSAIVKNDYMEVNVNSDRVNYKNDNFLLLTDDFSLLPKITEIEK